ncbi:hypothetical protein XaC1_27 [Xanthomonas phage XaC1]|nr:hypothetical protein XaC1_27 [Xanthomonas phage XaC1]
MKVIKISTYTYVPDAILKALSHIQEGCPDVHQVQYDEDGNWLYINRDGTATDFGKSTVSINQEVLEQASDAAYSVGYPVTFVLP